LATGSGARGSRIRARLRQQRLLKGKGKGKGEGVARGQRHHRASTHTEKGTKEMPGGARKRMTGTGGWRWWWCLCRVEMRKEQPCAARPKHQQREMARPLAHGAAFACICTWMERRATCYVGRGSGRDRHPVEASRPPAAWMGGRRVVDAIGPAPETIYPAQHNSWHPRWIQRRCRWKRGRVSCPLPCPGAQSCTRAAISSSLRT
jgi:hypothetical protein